LGLPKMNGLVVVQTLRAEGRTLPILILTARSSWQDKVKGLETGADDYLVKPFEYPELAARVKALLRRALKASSDVLTFGALQIDFSAQHAQFNGLALELTTFEYRVLAYLMHHRDEVVSRSDLVEHIYAQDFDRDSNTVEVFIARLRKKLPPGLIETVRGLGYRLTAQQ